MLINKTNILLAIFNVFILFFIISYIYNGKSSSFIDPDDNFHLLLKSETTKNCIKRNCKGLNFFATELNKKKEDKENKSIAYLSSRQIQRVIASYHPLPSYYLSFLNYFTDENSIKFKIFLITNILLLNLSLFYFCRDYISSKYLYIFLIFIFLALNTTMKASYMYAHSTSFAFFLLSLNNVFHKKNYIGVIFALLSILSHSIGIAYSLMYLLCFFLNSNKFFSFKKVIFYLAFILLILFFYKFNLKLTNLEITNDNIFNRNFDGYSIAQLIKYKIVEIKRHLETIPVFASFGIYFIALCILYGLTNNEKTISNQKNLFIIIIALIMLIFVALFSSSTLIILERLQPIIMLIIYITVFSILTISFKEIKRFINKNSLKDYKLKNFDLLKLDLLKIFSVIIFLIFCIVFFRIEFLKSDGIKYIAYLKNLDDSNYNSEEFINLKKIAPKNSIFLVDGSEANLYFHILNGLYNYKFYWSSIYDNSDRKNIINQINYLIVDNNINFTGRKNDKVHQYNNQLSIDRNSNLLIENINTSYLILNLISPVDNASILINNKSLKDYIIKKGYNEIKIKLKNLDNKFVLSSSHKLLISSIKISENQNTNWPWNSNILIKKKSDDFTSGKEINFKISNLLEKKYNCSDFELHGDDDLFVYFKVDC